MAKRKKKDISNQELLAKYYRKRGIIESKVKNLLNEIQWTLYGYLEPIREKYEFNEYNEKLLGKKVGKLLKLRDDLKKVWKEEFESEFEEDQSIREPDKER